MAKIENTLPPILTGGTSIHDDLSGLNVGEYIHLTALEKIKFDNLPNSFAPVDAEKNVNTDWNAISGDEQLLNKPLTFPPSIHTHVEADITDLDKYTQLEVDNLLNDKVDKVAGKSLIDDTEITRLASVTNFDNSGNVTALGNKVDKIVGKGLSEEDYTTVEKSKLSGIEIGAEVNVNADWNATSGDAQILNKPTIPSISGLATEGYVDGKITQTIINGNLNTSPSEDAIFDVLALKQDNLTWVDYSTLTTTVGWSSFTQKRLWYLDFGSHILLYYRLVGNGNGINNSFTVPFNATQEAASMHIVMNNGTYLNYPGRGSINSGSNVVNLYATIPGSTWSAGAATKIASGIILIKK